MDIVGALYKTNRWWVDGRVPSAFFYGTVRDELDKVLSLLPERRISVILGPRRVGKSTILYQTVDRLLRDGVPRANVLLFSGDDPALMGDGVDMGAIIDAYASEVLRRNLEDEGAGRVYVLIDEIHFLKDWQLFLKNYFDRRLDVKFIVSGSSSVHLFKDSRDSLMGRTDEVRVLPLDFRQFVSFAAAYADAPFDAGEYLRLLPDRGAASAFDDPSACFERAWENRRPLAECSARIGALLAEYMLAGGYPEYFEARDIVSWQMRLASDIVQKALYKDIVSIYRIKNPEIMERLMFLVASDSGGERSFTSLGATLGVDTATVSSYVDYLSQSFLLTLCDNYSPNAGKVVRKNKKIYVSDNGVRNALLRNDTIGPEDAGMNAENLCVQAARRAAESQNYKVCFWREKGREVDIVVDKKNGILPVEVKYRNDVSPHDLTGLTNMMERFGLAEGLVVTKNKLEKSDGIVMLPIYCVA